MGQHHTDKPGGAPPSLDDVVVEWVHAITDTSSPPMSFADARQFLGNLAEQLVAALSAASVDTQAASDVGARLVAGGFTGAQSLPRTFDVLGQALPAAGAAVDRPCGRIIELLGAMAAGYTWALRNRDLRACEARFRAMFDSSPVGIAISRRSGRIVETNRSLENTLGYSSGDLTGRKLSELLPPGDLSVVEQHHDLATGQDARFRIRLPLCRADGETAWVHVASSVLLDHEQTAQEVVTMVEDLTDLHLLEQRLNHQTLHDVQTGLPNRQYLITYLEKVLARLEPPAMVTLMHLDLDGFSAVNDGLGHHAGDQLLDLVARRLESVVARQRAMVARLGADDYAIVIESDDSVLDVGALAEIINTELAKPVSLDGVGVAVTASIGVAQTRVAATSPAKLMRAASATLRRVRDWSKRQWDLFDPEIDAADRAERRLAAAMPGALKTGELAVAYQPVVTLRGERLVGIEAGLCWQHPQLGVLSHEQCVQAAERTGVVHEVGQWLLRNAAEQAVSWRQRIGCSVAPVVVDLTPSQAQDPDLVARVTAVLDETGLTPAELELRAPAAAVRTVAGELAGEGGAHAEDNLRVMIELGVRAGLHDFGGGMGALRCVADLKVCVVKVAQPVSYQVRFDQSRILSQAAQALVHNLRAAGVDVVAFPVDCAEQAACWPWIGANWGVGALFGQPGPPWHIEALLDAQARS
ncbi:MAG: putative bifunctional diguanylate cyclase/phosphodiesterase [Pseudonocardiaceae bacterium]